MGMGAYAPRVVSPLTGAEESNPPSLGRMFPQEEENLPRWRVWWKNVNREQPVGFFGRGLRDRSLLYAPYASLYDLRETSGFGFITDEGAKGRFLKVL